MSDSLSDVEQQQKLNAFMKDVDAVFLKHIKSGLRTSKVFPEGVVVSNEYLQSDDEGEIEQWRYRFTFSHVPIFNPRIPVEKVTHE